MKIMLALVFAVVLVGVVVAAVRRGSGAGGYRRRFENVYRRAEDGAAAPGVVWMPVIGYTDPGAHGADGSHCGGGVTDGGGASGCGADGGGSS